MTSHTMPDPIPCVTPKCLIIIPARLASTRLPGKPLADIGGKPMIVHVMERAARANVGDVYVACAEQEIANAVSAHNGQYVMTDPDLPSGTDRVHAALNTIDPNGRYTVIVNLQGDMPTIDPDLIADVVTKINSVADTANISTDIVTAAVKTDNPREMQDPNVVKAVLTPDDRALYFSRATVPHGADYVWHHIGIYAYRREALNRFCALPPSPLEAVERLEQLRALEAGMAISVVKTETAPEGVDTPEDLERARAVLAPTTLRP